MESGNKMFFIDNLMSNKHFIYIKILIKNSNISLKKFPKMNT